VLAQGLGKLGVNGDAVGRQSNAWLGLGQLRRVNKAVNAVEEPRVTKLTDGSTGTTAVIRPPGSDVGPGSKSKSSSPQSSQGVQGDVVNPSASLSDSPEDTLFPAAAPPDVSLGGEETSKEETDQEEHDESREASEGDNRQDQGSCMAPRNFFRWSYYTDPNVSRRQKCGAFLSATATAAGAYMAVTKGIGAVKATEAPTASLTEPSTEPLTELPEWHGNWHCLGHLRQTG